MAEKYWWEEYQQDKEKKSSEQSYWWEGNNIANAIGSNITNRVNTWLRDHSNYVSNYQNRFSSRKGSYEDSYVSDSGSWLDTVSKQADAFETERQSILSYMDQNKDYLDAGWVQNIRNTLNKGRDTQLQIRNSATKDNEYWAMFTPNSEQTAAGYTAEKLYKAWQAEQRQYADDLAFDVEAGMADLEAMRKEKDAYLADQEEKRKQARANESFLDKLVRWGGNSPDTTLPIVGSAGYSSDTISTSGYDKMIAEKEEQIERAKYVQGYQGYMDNIDARDYAANSKYVSTRTDVAMEDAIWGAPANRYDESKLFGDFDYDYINRHPDALEAASVNDTHGAHFYGIDQEFLQTMYDNEIGVYNYLYKTQGPEAAKEFLKFIESDLEGRKRIQEQEYWAKLAKEAPGKTSAFSVMMAPLKGLSYLGQAADMLDDGKIDENAGYNRFTYIPSTIRSQVSTTIEKSGKWGKVGSFAYNTGMSMADFLFTTGVSGGNQALSLAIMGSGAAADATLAAKDRGLGDGEAFALGTIAGLAEVAMEKVSLGAWLEGDMSEGALRYVLKNALSEGGEEAGTSLANLLADVIIAGDKSEWNMAIQAYIDEGKSQEEAFGLVLAEQAAQIGLDALGGMLSGFAIGSGTYAGTSVASAFKYGDIAKNQSKAQALVSEGIEFNPESKYVQKAKAKVDKGKNLTGMQVRNILAANQEHITANDMKLIQKAAEKRLTELGQTKDVAKVAELATKWATGGELTSSEKNFLTTSEYGSRVANELLPKNIASEDFSTEWAENIGTKQVNYAAYNKQKLQSILEAMANTEDPASYKSLEERVGTEGRFGVAESGNAVIRETDEAIDISTLDVATVGDGQMTFKVGDREVSASEIDFADENQSYLVSAVSDIENITPAAATAIIRDIDLSKPVGEQLNGIDEAYTYGYYGYSEADLKAGNFAPNLTNEQMMSAYKLGQSARKISDTNADAPIVKMRTAAEAKLSAAEKTAQQKAHIESDDVEVYFEDGKTITKFDEHTGKYDKKRMAAVNTAKFLSKLGIGGKYYFFESYLSKTLKDEKGNALRVYKDANGNEVEAPNGMYKDGDGSIHIDLNAGDYGQGTALFTMGHELTHFIKAQSKKQFKVLCDLVTEAFDKTDLSMHERVLAKQKFLEDKRGEDVSYTEAYEEVVADAMATMLTDGSFYDKLMEIKVKDKGLFNTIKRFFEKMIAKFKKVYEELTPDQRDAQDIRAMKDMFDRIQDAFVEGLVEASDNFHAAMESVVETKAEPVGTDEILTDGAVVTDGEGERFSIRSMKHDIAEGKMFEDLKNVCGWTDAQVNTLRTQLKDLVEYMIPYRAILDMNETYGMEGRRFAPYKPNSDPLYKISMDFSTLCSKRLLTQYVIEQLQLRENRPMSAEEQMAIRDMLNEYRKVEKGLQVACAMCYVEAARLKSPKQIQRWLNDPAPLLKDYFGKKNKAFNDAVKKAQADFKESKGYDREAPKKDMKPADVKELNKIGPKMRSQYQLSAEEQAIVERAKKLPNSTYLTAGNLADLSEAEPVIYDAYTAFVRTATRSKSLEQDEPYYYGDSTRDNGNGIVVTDSFIEAVNRENGMRFSSWSDWRIIHLLDYITAVIDNSVRGAAMHGYTKFGDEVRVLGKTGMMFNMSGVAGTQTGLNEDGSLNFSSTESIDVNEAIRLREEFPEHAGLQCIGVSDGHIIALLRSDIIDYVIPYHVSGLNADLRRMAKIYGWDDYTGTQHAAIDKSIKYENAVDKEHWHEEPVFSEFFVGYDTGMSGIEAMRASAEKYKQMCKDRGLTPKFNQFATEDNYWKLLIDRKMINQKTGNLIQQKAVTPTFDFDTIKSVVDKFVENYDAGLEARALNHIVENWDSIPQRIKDLKKQGGTKAKKTKKAAATLANQTVAAQPKDGVKNSDRKWKPNLDSTEWDIVKYAVDHNQGTAITSTCNMFFKKSKGRTVFGIYSTDDSTLLYASRKSTAERECLFLEQFLEAYENGNVTDTSAEGLHTWAKTVRMQQNTGTRDDSTYVAPGRSAGDAAVYGRPSELYSSAALRNVLENIFQKETAGRTGDGSVKKSERSAVIASDFASHMDNIVKTNRGWYAKDVFKYVEEHPELGFIELIYAKDKDAKKLLEKFLGGIDDVKVLDQLSWFMGEAYGDKDRTWNPYDGATYPYRGAVRTFRNAIKKRINAIMTEKVGGTNLGIKNGEVTLGEVKEMFARLNSNEEIGQFAEKVFATAEKLGVNIRFVNQTLAKAQVAGDNLGDMVEYKTSYFNDTTVTDQRKASTILHELIHACTVYVLDANKTMGDVSWNKSENYNRISNAATRLNRIYFEISYDTDFQGQYGIKNAKEMVAELANEEFVGLMKKKNLWDSIVDWICDLFGIRRGTSAYDNARLCVDYILDNPEVSEYKAHAAEQRRNASRNGYEVFGQTRFSERNSAPTFYSQMGKVVEGMKHEKFGASSVISMLRGRGVKAEEIRWSGIQAFLDGKKSVTKAELLEFIKGSMLHIEEQMLDGTRAERAKLPDNYRLEETADDSGDPILKLYIDDELVDTFEQIFDGSISSTGDSEIWAMNEADLVGQILNHYAGMSYDEAYGTKESNGPKWGDYKLNGGENYRELVFKMPGSTYTNNAMRGHWGDDAQGVLAHARIQDFDVDGKKMLFIEEIQSDWHNEGHAKGYESAEYVDYDAKFRELNEKFINSYMSEDAYMKENDRLLDLEKQQRKKGIGTIPHAPFGNNYHEYVLKRLLRMAAEEGYDSIGWTTADIQSERWSEDFAEGYRIEYDQDIPKFLKKYGKQWDAIVGKTTLPGKTIDLDAELGDEWLLDDAELPDGLENIRENQWVDDYENGTEIWSMDITPAMKKSVLEEGQAMYSERGDGTSNRSLLANAFEGIVQDSVEYKMIQDYKSRIKELNELETKLSQLNAEIRKIRFGTTGTRDTQRLTQLENEAKDVAKEINRYDKRLLSLEASEPLRKVIERERKKEALKTIDHVKEIVQNKKARAEQAELRHKIRKTIRDLDKLLNRGNKKTNVKEDMKGFASKALELADYLFTDHISNDELIRQGITVRMTPKEAALVKETEDILSQLYDNADSLTDEEFTRLDAKRKANEDKLRDLLTAQRNERLNIPVYNLFNDLVTEYANLKNSKQDAVKAAYDPNVERFLRSYIGETNGETDSDRKTLLQNMRVADMTTDELWKLHNAYKMVLHSVRDANNLWVKGKTETIEQMAGRIMGDFSKRKAPDGKVAIIARNIANKIGWDYEKLYYALDRIGSEAFTELVMNIANSENIVMQDVMEAAAFRDEMVKKYGFNNWDVNKEIDKEFLDNTGKKFKLTLGQLMALYAYSRREGAWDHIEYGGFVFGEAALTNPKPADSYKLNKEQCKAITNTLTKEQKAYAEEMQKFLSETMGEKGNEVSMLLYGIKMFGEKNYFPIHIAGQFKAQANESQAKAAAGFSSMSNAGFTHAQNPNAKAPFVLEGFNEIWVDHVNEMSRYHGTVPALEDMRRVMNRSFYSESGAESLALKQMMENAYGKEAVEYFDNLYREANSGAITDKLQKKSKKLLSLFRKNSVAYSLSVLVQQPASMVRAYAMIPKKYFGFKGFGTITSGIAKAVSDRWTKAHTNAYNEMLKYAPGVTMAKEIGGFDTATGGSIRSYLLDTSKSLKQKWKTGNLAEKGKAVLDLVDDNAIANLPNLADKIAWIEIWNACKRETVATHKDLTPNSEEFMQAVGERFTEVIRATQVYDSIFAKSPMLKSKNLAVQYLVSFMNEPNTVANMAESAVRDATRGDWKGGAKKAAVLIHSIIFTNLLKSLIYAMRDDDEDETYIEKYIEAVSGNMMSDFMPLNYIPIARDAWSLAQGYDVERADMAIVADAIDALDSVIKNATKETEGMTEEQLIEFDKKCTEANWKLVESMASFFGIPVKNIRREIEGVLDHARVASANKGKTTKLSAWDKLRDSVIESIPFMQTKSKQDKLYEAIMAGDKTYVARLKAGYKDDASYTSAVRKLLRENDPRIHQAAQARYNGNITECKRIYNEIKNEGKFNPNDILEAINSEESKIRNEEKPETVSSSYSSTDFVNAILLGDTSAAEAMRGDIISAKVANGKSQEEAEEAFADSIATATRNAFDGGLLDEAGAEKMLLEYAEDMDEKDISSKVSYWSFCKAHPEYDLSQSNVEDYQEFAEPAEIPLDVFVQYVEGTKGLATKYDEWGDVEVSKRDQVLEVIDSLPLTWQQKDALYLAAGYSESTIWDVPW